MLPTAWPWHNAVEKNCEVSCSEKALGIGTGQVLTSPPGFCWTQCGSAGGQRGGGGGQSVVPHQNPDSLIVAGVTLAKLPTAEDIKPDT